MLKIAYTENYRKDLVELFKRSPDLKESIDQNVLLFAKNPEDTRLANHLLRKSMEGKWAFLITDNVRIVYEILGKHTVRFLAIGSHLKVYKRTSQPGS